MGTVTVGQPDWPPIQAVERRRAEPEPCRYPTAVDHHRVGPTVLGVSAGWTTEFAHIRSLLDDVTGGGGVLVLSGEQGIGKTALLDSAQLAASEMGMRVLRVNGAEFEADISFAGLHQLLVPLSADFGALPDRARRSIEEALDLGAGHSPDRLLVLNAVFALLREVAGRTATLLIVDDVQWFDQASTEVLAFVARRLAGTHVGLLVAMREGSDSLLGRVGLPAMRLPPSGSQATASGRRRLADLDQGVGRTIIDGRDALLKQAFRARLTIAPRIDLDRPKPRPPSSIGHLRSAPQALMDTRGADEKLRAATAKGADLLYRDGRVDDAHAELITAIDNSCTRPDPDLAGLVEALHLLSEACHYGGRAELWAPFRRALQVLGDEAPPALRLIERTCPDPSAVSAADLLDVEHHVRALGHGDPDPAHTVRIGMAAHAVDRLPGCREALRQVFGSTGENADGGNAAGQSGARQNAAGGNRPVRAGLLLALDAVDAGRWSEAQELADECVALCESSGQQLLAWSGRYVQALVAAGRGHWNLCRALTDEMLAWAAPRGASSLIREARHARRLAFLGRGDQDHAPATRSATLAPGTAGASAVRTDDPHLLRHGLDLVEAALRMGQHAAAAGHATALAVTDAGRVSPRFALQVAAAQALVAPDDLADRLFRAALDIPGIEQWPFDVARVQLAFGERLRRRQATRASREQLSAALDTFTQLGARPWVERAGAELRATGQTRHRHAGNSPAPLTPQELEIAELAATGLTNKEIGARMYVSPRTVSAHLYRVFPKLGITSRAALRDALLALPSSALPSPALPSPALPSPALPSLR